MVKFALDLGVIKTKVVSFSKKLFLLQLSLLSLGQYIKALIRDFPVMTSLSVNKWYIIIEIFNNDDYDDENEDDDDYDDYDNYWWNF